MKGTHTLTPICKKCLKPWESAMMAEKPGRAANCMVPKVVKQLNGEFWCNACDAAKAQPQSLPPSLPQSGN